MVRGDQKVMRNVIASGGKPARLAVSTGAGGQSDSRILTRTYGVQPPKSAWI